MDFFEHESCRASLPIIDRFIELMGGADPNKCSVLISQYTDQVGSSIDKLEAAGWLIDGNCSDFDFTIRATIVADEDIVIVLGHEKAFVNRFPPPTPVYAWVVEQHVLFDKDVLCEERFPYQWNFKLEDVEEIGRVSCRERV